MNKEKTKNILLDMFDTIEGTTEKDKETGAIMGHPNFYLIHSKEELINRIEEFINSKESFDRYDIYYFVKKALKEFLTVYDTHTKIFANNCLLPIDFRIIEDKAYITETPASYEHLKYKECISVNGVDIKKIISDIEQLTVYPSKEFLNTSIIYTLTNARAMLYLPCIKEKKPPIIFTTNDNDSIIFDSQFLENYIPSPKEDANYTVTQTDNIVICRYNSCKNPEGMARMLKHLSLIEQNNENTKYIIDLRGNSGGDSRIIEPLISFLKDKDTVTLIDEFVYSSGIMATLDLKRINSHIIGTDISSTINHFGNNLIKKEYADLKLKITASTKLFIYDDNYNPHSLNKTNIKEHIKTIKDLEKYDHGIFHPDEYVTFTIEDYRNNHDPQLSRAIEYLKEKTKKR